MKWIHRVTHHQLPAAWTFGICLFTLVVAHNKDVTGESSHASHSPYNEYKTSSSQPAVGQDVRHIHPGTKSAVLPWDVNNLEQAIEDENESTKQTRVSRSLHNKGKENDNNKNVQGSSKGGDNKKSSKKPRNSSSQLNESDRSSSSSSKGPKGKPHESKSHRQYMESETSGLPDDLPSLQEKTLSLGKLVLEFLRQEVLPRLPGELSDSVGSSRSQERALPFAETFANLFSKPAVRRQGNENDGGGVINRNQAIGWLARLIGVDGKTLGEFLREYQVHVLYDLVFTFFKWIFFLYAGLLIP